MSFRTTYKQDKKTYVEDRGYAHIVASGTDEYAALDAEFGKLLKVGQTAVRNSDGDGWTVEDGFPLLERMKDAKLAKLGEAFEVAGKKPFVVTAEGWRADANEDANRNVKSLIDRLEMTGEESAIFMDYDNIERPIDLAGLKALYLQIIQNGSALYAAKWVIRSAIVNAVTVADLEAVEISFAGA